MHPTIIHHLATARAAELRSQAQRDALARAARHARTHKLEHAAPRLAAAGRRLLTSLRPRGRWRGGDAGGWSGAQVLVPPSADCRLSAGGTEPARQTSRTLRHNPKRPQEQLGGYHARPYSRDITQCDLERALTRACVADVLSCFGGRLRRSQLTRLNLGGRLCADDGDDGARPIAPGSHLIAKGIPRDRPAGGRAVLGVEFPGPGDEIAGTAGVSLVTSRG